MENSQNQSLLDRILRCSLAAVLIGFLCTFPAASSTRCGITGPVHTLVDDMRQVVQHRGRLPASLAKQVGQSAAAVSISRVITRLETLDLPNNGNVVKDLLGIATKISRTGIVGNLFLVEWHLRIVEKMIAQACSADPRPIASPSEKTSVSEVLLGLFGSSGALGNTTKENVALRLSSLAAFLGATIASIFGSRILYNWGYALFYSRQACRINAILELGIEVVDVHITILGRNGCRFQPVNDGAFKRVEGLVHVENPTVIVGRHRLPIRIHGLHGYFVSSFFVTPLSRKMHTLLLVGSAITPFHVKKSIPKSNVTVQGN